MFSLYFGHINSHVHDICNLCKTYKNVTSWPIGIHLYIGLIMLHNLKNSDNLSFHFKMCK